MKVYWQQLFHILKHVPCTFVYKCFNDLLIFNGKESYIHMHTSRSFETSLLQYLSTFLYFVGTICLLLKKMEILCMTGTTPKISKHIPMFRACF